MRHTKIVCTIGPASSEHGTLRAMIRAGMDVARLNTSHGTLEEHAATAAAIRRAAKGEGKHVGILMDLAGPKLRTGELAGARPVPLVAGTAVLLTDRPVASSEGVVSLDYPQLTSDVSPGDPVLLDDGQLEVLVEEVAPEGARCRVVTGGLLGAHKGVSFPRTRLSAPALTPRDREAIAAGIHAGVDLFALSFVRDADDLVRTRDAIADLGADIPIIAKIERRQAVENLDAILAAADGAMVARGDLGVELAPEEVPVQQRRIIDAAARHLVPVITATQMLESMMDAPRPTRAEASDVANAVWDLSDALMLSGETAVGRYPVETVTMMERIIRRAESAPGRDRDSMAPRESDDHSYVLARAARHIVESDPNMSAIVCFTQSGYTALLVSKVHPNAPIYALSPEEAVCRRLSLARSVIPVYGPVVKTSEELLHMVDATLHDLGHLSDGDECVVVASLPVQARGATNFLKLHRLGESAAYS
jgi:pyruvate kinase